MKMYRIVTDGSCDLGTDLTKKLDVDVVPFYISLDGVNYQKEIAELGIREFYQFMVDNPKVFPKTSMPSIQDYLDAFKPLAAKKIDIICICITTKFSGSYNSAINAKEILLEDYPDVKIEVIDATVNTVLQGMLVEEAVAKKNSGASFEETVAFINDIKSTGRIFFTIGSMDYLIHGGRVGKLSGIAAGALGIKPLILLKEGEIFNNGITRGRKKSKANGRIPFCRIRLWGRIPCVQLFDRYLQRDAAAWTGGGSRSLGAAGPSGRISAGGGI